MATTFTLDELYEEPAQPATKPASSGWRVSPEEQATRDEERMRILQREAADPDLPGGAASRAAVSREIQRAGGAAPAKVKQAKPAAAQTTFSLEELYGEPAKAKPEFDLEAMQAANREEFMTNLFGKDRSISGQASQMAKGTIQNFAALGDMLNGLPHQAMSWMADLNTRLGGLVQGKPHAQVSAEAEARRNEILGAAPHAISDLASAVLRAEDASGVDKVMGTVDSWFDEKGDQVQTATGGALRREDVKSLVNEVFALAGTAGMRAGAKAHVKAKLDARAKVGQPEPLTNEQAAQQRISRQADEAAEAAAETKRLEARANAEPAALEARSVERLRAQAAQREAVLTEQKQVQAETKAMKAKRNDVKAAFAEDPVWADYLRDRAETEALVREGRRAEAARLQPEEMAPRTRAAERTLVDEQARTIETIPGLPPDQLRIDAPDALTTGLAKASRGRSFDMTAQELAAVRASKSQWDRPKIYVPKGQRGAVDVDALIPKEPGQGLSAAELRSLATLSLGSLLKHSEYTMKTLDRLPQNRTEFTKQMIEEQLKRPDVTAAEKGIFKEILDAVEGPTVPAHELMARFKQETGSFELKPKATEEFADYGLDRIGREEPAPNSVEAFEGQGLRATTNVYRLPSHMTFGTGNHFGDPRYFGHTRSFVEDGVRHVVEMQSDLAQKTKGAVKPEERAGLIERNNEVQKTVEKHTDLIDALDARLDKLPFERYDDPIREGLKERRATLWQERAAAKVEAREIRAKLEATAVDSQLSPILKNWHKRLIREELGQAAEAGEKTVRFATGETVAKVEGWPDKRVELAEDIAFREKDIAANERALSRGGPVGTGAGGLRLDVATELSKQQLAELKKQLAALPEGPALRSEHAGIKNRYDTDVAKFLKQLGGKTVTDSAGHSWIEVPVPEAKGPRGGQRQMFGGADADLLTKIGAAGAGAAVGLYLADDNQLGAAGLGAVGGLLLAGKTGAAAVKGADYGLGLVSTRIRNISEPLLKRARDYEGSLLRNAHVRIAATDPFLQNLNKLKGPDAAKLDLALVSNDAAALKVVLDKHPEMLVQWEAVAKTIQETGRELTATGVLKNLRQDYLFPRIVTDRVGLLDKLGVKAREGLEQALHEAEAKAVRATGEGLSALEESQLINQYLRGGRNGQGGPGFTKGRVIDEVTPKLRPFYASPTEALHTYLSSATRAIEKAKFFGKNLVKGEDGRIDTNASIGEVVRRELEAGKIDYKQAQQLREMLESRFGAGERGASPLVQHVRNLTNAGLLGNVVSAASQIGDTMVAAYAHGMRPTLEALTAKIAGKQRVTARDFGLVDHISEEFVSTSSSAKFLNQMFKWSGFTAIDLLGKDVHLNAALSKFERLAKTPKGQAEIAGKYKDAFGEDYPALIEDLKSRKLTDNTRSLLFSELSDMQPISKLEMPQGYLDMPNGRFVYMLKSFMLKQVDIVRRDAYNEIKKGNVAKGTGNLLKFSLALGIAGASTDMLKDWIMGRKVDFDKIDIAGNMLKTFGWSSYVADKVRQGKPLEAARDVALPPYRMWDDIVRRDPKAVQYFPVGGKLFYSHAMDGAEKADAAKAKAERRKTKKEKAYGL